MSNKTKIITIDSSYDSEPVATIDTDMFIEVCLEEDKVMQAAFDKFQEDSENHWELEDISDFIEHIGWFEAVGDNSSNSENDLSSVIDYVIATKNEGDDYIYPSDEVLVFLRVHQGGDIRGNYSDVQVYRFNDSASECAFWERTVGWSLFDAKDRDGNELTHEQCQEIDERWQNGYSSAPTYELYKDLETCELSECGEFYLITLKDGTTGKVSPHNYSLEC